MVELEYAAAKDFLLDLKVMVFHPLVPYQEDRLVPFLDLDLKEIHETKYQKIIFKF